MDNGAEPAPGVGGIWDSTAGRVSEAFGEDRNRSENARRRSARLAEILLIDAWTGLRWSEPRTLRVRDFVEVPLPILVVQVAEPEGVAVEVTKSRKSRRVPVADRILPMVRRMATTREPDAPLFTTYTGHQLHATAFKRTLDWRVVGSGRRIHDLRHTAAACGWRVGSIRSRCRPGWVTRRSRRRICTCNIWERPLTSPDWPA